MSQYQNKFSFTSPTPIFILLTSQQSAVHSSGCVYQFSHRKHFSHWRGIPMWCERSLEEKNKKATILLNWCHKSQFHSDLLWKETAGELQIQLNGGIGNFATVQMDGSPILFSTSTQTAFVPLHDVGTDTFWTQFCKNCLKCVQNMSKRYNMSKRCPKCV